jgi:hypothetical protein
MHACKGTCIHLAEFSLRNIRIIVAYHNYRESQNYIRSQSSVVSIATRLQAAGFGVRIPVGAADFSLLQNIQMDSEPTKPPIQWVPCLFPEDKVTGL